MYQCVAGNKHGEVYSNAELKVIGKAIYKVCGCTWLTAYIPVHVLHVVQYARLLCACFSVIASLFFHSLASQCDL